LSSHIKKPVSQHVHRQSLFSSHIVHPGIGLLAAQDDARPVEDGMGVCWGAAEDEDGMGWADDNEGSTPHTVSWRPPHGVMIMGVAPSQTLQVMHVLSWHMKKPGRHCEQLQCGPNCAQPSALHVCGLQTVSCSSVHALSTISESEHLLHGAQSVSLRTEQALTRYSPALQAEQTMQVLSWHWKKSVSHSRHRHWGPYDKQPGTEHVCAMHTVSAVAEQGVCTSCMSVHTLHAWQTLS